MNPRRIYLTALILLLLAAVPLWADQAPAKPTTLSQEMPTPRQQGEHWGYVNAKGDFVIRPIFDSADAFSEGVAAVCLRQTISVVTNPASGHAHKNVEELCGFIDRQGTFVILPQFESAGGFSEGLAPVRPYSPKGNLLWGFIDHSGRVVIKPQFDQIGSFVEGRALFITGGFPLDDSFVKSFVTMGYIDPSGKRVIHSRFFYFFYSDFSEGMVPFLKNFGKWGYMDRNGKVVIRAKFDWAGDFSHGNAPVMIHEKCLRIDRMGQITGQSVTSKDSFIHPYILKRRTIDFSPPVAPCRL